MVGTVVWRWACPVRRLGGRLLGAVRSLGRCFRSGVRVVAVTRALGREEGDEQAKRRAAHGSSRGHNHRNPHLCTTTIRVRSTDRSTVSRGPTTLTRVIKPKRQPVMSRSALALVLLFGCANRTGELVPPSGAEPFPPELIEVFDNRLSLTAVELKGRAPHDVKDQRLFGQRLGFADLVWLGQVTQVWTRRTKHGRARQFIGLNLDDVLVGRLPAGSGTDQTLEVEAHDPLSGELVGEPVIWFIRWAPDESPPYRYHLMHADTSTVAYIEIMVRHAKDAGVLTGRGDRRERHRRP